MAGNRMQKIGSVFSRTRNLLRIGVVPKPLWFDVYAAFPPLREPVYRSPRPRYGKVKDVIPPIFYPEDDVRARFYSVYGSGPRPFDLSQSNFKSTCQRFVEKFNELKEEGKIEEDKLFEETGKALLAKGIILQRRGTEKVWIALHCLSRACHCASSLLNPDSLSRRTLVALRSPPNLTLMDSLSRDPSACKQTIEGGVAADRQGNLHCCFLGGDFIYLDCQWHTQVATRSIQIHPLQLHDCYKRSRIPGLMKMLLG
ncbi:small ribosomal subunit protein mS23 isoform X5 [Dromaius novaehollandiae]|uniref:small ribosomal subunit protein mS23 isoform X5 n=1 Tax=Dromaius novaehollandiae TaxID=8790 RepID=UPI00311E568C